MAGMNLKTMRAQPLSVDDRQSMIIDAVIPLLLEHGRAVTSSQMARAAGIAEGTIFRAFGDKESLIRAAADRYLDPVQMRRDLGAIDVTLPLEQKVRMMIDILQTWFRGVFGMMALIGARERPPVRPSSPEYTSIIGAALQADIDQLGWSTERIAHVIRLVSFSSALPQMNEGTAFSLDELTSIVMFGIAGRPRIKQPTSRSTPERKQNAS
jgi:AcrR family transcriptional regulator